MSETNRDPSADSPPVCSESSQGQLEPPQDFERGLSFWAIIIGLSITNLLGALENTVVSTSAPVILTDLQLGGNYIWITNAFFVCSAAFQPLFGQLCNIFGRRWITLVIVASKSFSISYPGCQENGQRSNLHY